ncbi:hypothetical protein Lrub_1564 [Legionella rubrilucens]|uniref:DUF2490 domain-containing protein n=1 Tax=Legionella rubrilucens TaxID=458 RepID=A0A0W0XQM5_9GAMM|nr:DUF2490 domain-containing protein [Legionella rubrilucens]KTD46642.1 hypothetical protein Lrub_1564 [Legionella rubrilucens]
MKSGKLPDYAVRIISSLFIGLMVGQAMAALPTHDMQVWANLTANGPLSSKTPKIKYWLEAQPRFGEDVSRLSQVLLRPGLGYALTPTTSIWAGYAWIYTTLPFASPSFDENRTWQQLLWSRKFNTVRLVSRTRLEQRFIQQNIHVAWRLRQFFKAEIPLPKQPAFTGIVSNEVFIHLNDFNRNNNQGFDQNRFFVGVGKELTRHVKAEAGYLNQTIRRVNSADYSGNYLSLNVLCNF